MSEVKTMEEHHQHEQAHIVIVPSPGMGHLIPFAEFAKLLVSRFDFSVTLLLPSRAHDQPTKAQSSFLDSLPNAISYDFLPPVDLSHLPEDVSHDVTLSLILFYSVPSIRAALSSLAKGSRVVSLVTDLFGTALFDVARELGVPPYMYFTTNAMYLLFLFHLPRLDKTVTCDFRDMANPLVLPGCVPIHGKDIEDALQDRKCEAYWWNLHHVKKYVLAEGIFINSFQDLEPGAFQALRMEDPSWPPVFPVGPIVRSDLGVEADGSECLRWLDQQPFGSVLFVSFGSGGTLSYEQLNELANGLERSGHRFLWVIRGPNDQSSFGSYFSAHDQHNLFTFLPEGFLGRTKELGFLVPSWAPQIKVLNHASAGGFLTHCGWILFLESIICGVPLIAWPLYAEQKTNAVILSEGLNVALWPESNHQGLVKADHVAKVVKDLMEGEDREKICHRMEELKNNAKKAIDETGDSTKLLNEIALKWFSSKSHEM